MRTIEEIKKWFTHKVSPVTYDVLNNEGFFEWLMPNELLDVESYDKGFNDGWDEGKEEGIKLGIREKISEIPSNQSGKPMTWSEPEVSSLPTIDMKELEEHLKSYHYRMTHDCPDSELPERDAKALNKFYDWLLEELHTDSVEMKPAEPEYREEPFDLEEALKHPEWVWTNNGLRVDVIRKVDGFDHIIISVMFGPFGYEGLADRNGDIGCMSGWDQDYDCEPDYLVIRKPVSKVKHEGWVNVYGEDRQGAEARIRACDGIFPSAEVAREYMLERYRCPQQVHIEWIEED